MRKLYDILSYDPTPRLIHSNVGRIVHGYTFVYGHHVTDDFGTAVNLKEPQRASLYHYTRQEH